MSHVEDLTYGIPHGSVVGPKCFTLYIQPVQEIIRKHGFLYHICMQTMFKNMQSLTHAPKLIVGKLYSVSLIVLKIFKVGCLVIN